MRLFSSLGLLVSFAALLSADGPADNQVDKVRRIPPLPKNPPSESAKAELQHGAEALGQEIDRLRTELNGKPDLLSLLPDIQIFQNALRYAANYDETFDTHRQVPHARN